MKVGFVSPHTFSYPGGVQKHTLALQKEFVERKHKVKLILPRERFSQEREKTTILLGSALYIPGNASKTNLSLNITPLSIWRRLRKERFDILHFQNFGVFLPIQILEAASQLSNPPLKILTLHALWDASLILREIPSVPTLMYVFKEYILPRFDGIIAVSKPVLSQIEAEYDGPKEVIPNGVNLNFFNPKGLKIEKFRNVEKKRLSNSLKLNILFVGRIEKRKGLIYLLKAFKILKTKYKDLKLIVVGEGERKKKLEDFVEKHKISGVFFEGEVKEKELAKYYRAADICCFPSIYGEAFGIVLLEAMASGRPVVAFANQGYKEVLTGKGSNFLARPKNVDDLVKKLAILIGSKNKREEMAEWGRREVKKCSWDKIADKTLKFYRKAIKYKSRSGD